MSKAALIELWRDLVLSDAAMEQYKNNRNEAVSCYDLSDEEREGLLSDDFAASYRSGVPQELLFQGAVLLGINPRLYIQKLCSGLNYTGRGAITADTVLGNAGNFTPST